MYEEVCYQKSFLKQVIVKIDFTSPISQLEKNVPVKLLNAIIKNFPIIEPEEVFSHEVSFEGSSMHSKQITIKQWNYYGVDRERQLSITPLNIFAVYTTYNNYEETKEQFGAVIDAFAKAFPDTKASRFGLRYINQIDIPIANPTLWEEYIDPTLLHNRQFFGDDEITRLISIAELRYDNVGVRFQYGMPNPDYPALLKRPLFVLDLDGSVTQAHDLTETLNNMDETHARIQGIYERSITNKLRDKMHARHIQQ